MFAKSYVCICTTCSCAQPQNLRLYLGSLPKQKLDPEAAARVGSSAARHVNRRVRLAYCAICRALFQQRNILTYILYKRVLLLPPPVPNRQCACRAGWKHTDNVKLHYKQFLDDFVKTQAANGGELLTFHVAYRRGNVVRQCLRFHLRSRMENISKFPAFPTSFYAL